ncbi:hypothetical protein MPPM_0117 [Methylorubrum populi]|jgi:hypothetical protein|uniref:Uncharacterized protein n=1 Tax=Methylorubrum populi TaxID=223967 RepID=A0A161JKZ8_9HYPH|nr:hypothetical protein [Methylorubrum populi]BAU88722.1 hypothetical protein MPPM_0117 [Methylorubrum populi]
MGDEGIVGGEQVDDLTKLYKTDPSIEHYVRLRREKPGARIEVAVIGGLESMFYMREEFERYGIDPDLLGGILDADPEAVSEVSLRLMEKMIEARQMDGAGQTHLIRRGMAIPDRLIDWVISCSLDAMSWNDELEVPRDLIVLIRERLGGPKPQYEQEREVRHKKSSAEILAGQLKAKGITPTFRLLGQYLNVAPSTVKRWFAPGELEEASDRWATFYDENGQMLPLNRVGR